MSNGGNNIATKSLDELRVLYTQVGTNILTGYRPCPCRTWQAAPQPNQACSRLVMNRHKHILILQDAKQFHHIMKILTLLVAENTLVVHLANNLTVLSA